MPKEPCSHCCPECVQKAMAMQSKQSKIEEQAQAQANENKIAIFVYKIKDDFFISENIGETTGTIIAMFTAYNR